MSVSVLVTSDFALAPAIEADWLAQLPAARRGEIGRWPDTRARQRSLLGSRLLAEGLRRLGYPASALSTLHYAPRSKPTLGVPVDFSLSHCEGRVVCALSTRGAVGIDVERLEGLQAGEFQLYLSAAERAWAGRSARRFYTLWTRKEAVAKAAGRRGLRDVARVDTMPSRHDAAFEGRLWRTPVVAVGRHHVAHLALADEAREITISRLEPQTFAEAAHAAR